jgi:hypothetical protein
MLYMRRPHANIDDATCTGESEQAVYSISGHVSRGRVQWGVDWASQSKAAGKSSNCRWISRSCDSIRLGVKSHDRPTHPQPRGLSHKKERFWHGFEPTLGSWGLISWSPDWSVPRSVADRAAESLFAALGPSFWFGTALILLGVIVNVVCTWSHISLGAGLERGESGFAGPSAITFAVILAAIGMSMAILRRFGSRARPGA